MDVKHNVNKMYSFDINEKMWFRLRHILFNRNHMNCLRSFFWSRLRASEQENGNDADNDNDEANDHVDNDDSHEHDEANDVDLCNHHVI